MSSSHHLQSDMYSGAVFRYDLCPLVVLLIPAEYTGLVAAILSPSGVAC